MKKKVGIIGASGYTGHELLKILKNHPSVKLEILNSRNFAGRKVSSLYEDFTGDDVYTGFDYKSINSIRPDLIFLALPHTLSMAAVQKLDKRIRVVDLSADFRFKDPILYEKAYNHKPAQSKNNWIYGLPELFRDKIKTARFVANPGCYAACSILAAYPVQKLAERIIFDCKSGYSGAGRNSDFAKDPSIIEDNLIAYNLTRHRHKYEIQQFIGPDISFTPHVFNTFQGMMCTAHIILKQNTPVSDIKKAYEKYYKNSPFVRIKDKTPDVADTRKTNFCDIGGFEIDGTNRLVVVSTIDNLWKGASAQAVSNMNLMLGFNETQGLRERP